MRGAYLHSTSTPSWRGAPLKKAQRQLYLYLLHNYFMVFLGHYRLIMKRYNRPRALPPSPFSVLKSISRYRMTLVVVKVIAVY
jgi:hypothetical protein